MKAIVKEKPIKGKEWRKGLQLIDREIPTVQKPNEMKLQVLAAAICGTDVGIYNCKQSIREEMKDLEKPFVTVGHEFCGRIVDAGELAKEHLAAIVVKEFSSEQVVNAFVKGRNVAEVASDNGFIELLADEFVMSSEMHITCGTCLQCRTGNRHVCRNTIIKGIHDDGAFAGFVIVPMENVVLFKKGEIPVEVIAFMDAIGNATHTAQSVNLMGQSVAVLGCGVQGLAATAIARYSGASQIFVTDASHGNVTTEKLGRGRFNMARKFGADYCFDVGLEGGRKEFLGKVFEETNGTGVDVVFEMSGNYRAYADAFDAVRMGGTISLLGLPEGDMKIDFSKEVIFKGITLHGIIGRRVFETWEVMRAMLKHGLADQLVESGFITHDLPLERFEEGFAAIKEGDALKVILRP
jgi:threonine 3-dehydrogenase